MLSRSNNQMLIAKLKIHINEGITFYNSLMPIPTYADIGNLRYFHVIRLYYNKFRRICVCEIIKIL